MKIERFTFYILLSILFSFHFASCELVDDEHCQFTRDKIGSWNPGYEFTYFGHEATTDLIKIDFVFLGAAQAMLKLEDVCTGKPVMVTAELNTNHYDSNIRPYLYVYSKYDNRKFGSRGLRMTGTTENATVYKAGPVEVPVWPDFSSNDYSGNLIMTIGFDGPELGFNTEDEIRRNIEIYLENLVKDAKITATYTYY
jgi:hypothetical protein